MIALPNKLATKCEWSKKHLDCYSQLVIQNKHARVKISYLQWCERWFYNYYPCQKIESTTLLDNFSIYNAHNLKTRTSLEPMFRIYFKFFLKIPPSGLSKVHGFENSLIIWQKFFKSFIVVLFQCKHIHPLHQLLCQRLACELL